MRALIVASSGNAPEMEHEIAEGRRPRLDYFELAAKLGARYVDYDSPPAQHSPLLRSWERRLRLDFCRAWKVAETVEKEGYTLVFSWSERMAIPLAFLLDRRVRHVALLHKPLSRWKLFLLKALGVFRRWDAMMTFSEAEASALRGALRLGADRIRPLPWGVDTEFYRPLEDVAEEREKPHILSIGLSNRDYGTLIEAMRLLPEVECHICATSAWESADDLFGGTKLPDNVVLKSYDHPEEIREAYGRCRFVVIPMRKSTSQWSAGCTSVLQPQAMGKPVIATHLPGLAEYLDDGKTGLLVEGADPTAMAQAIGKLWDDPERRAAMGRRARQWVTENRSFEVAMSEIGAILSEVAEYDAGRSEQPEFVSPLARPEGFQPR